MEFIRLIIIRLTWRLKGLNIYSKYKELLSHENWSENQWEQYNIKSLNEFIQYCYNNTTYYKDLFDQNDIKVSKENSFTDNDRIPILTKEDVRANVDNMLNHNIDKYKLKKTNTSGSTGTPLTLYSDKNRQEYLAAGLWRIYTRCGWKPGERIAYIWGFKPGVISKNSLFKKAKEFLTGATYLSAWKANDEDFFRWYNSLLNDNIKLIVCYASSGSRFASWILDKGLEVPGIKGVYCTSEKLFDYQKEIIEKAFKCKVYNFYGCGEVNHVACTCKEGNMHINLDLVNVEEGPVNENGDTPLLLTGFTNLGMPFLRYMNGDAGKMLSKKCTCGLNTPLLDLNVTRLADVFTFKNNKKYPSLYFILRLYKDGFEGVELFQFYQDKIDHIYLYIVKNINFNDKTHQLLKDVLLEIENHIGEDLKVELIYTDYIEQSKSSKHYYAKSDIK